MRVDKLFLIILLIGLVIRLLLAFLPGFYVDTNVWFAWSQRLQLGFNHFYSNDVWTNYTPGYLYILGGLGFIRNLFNLSSDTFYYILKLPAILAEITLAFLIFRFMSKYGSLKLARLAAAFIVFNPALIFNSSIWGQIDSILTYALFLTIYYLGQKKFLISSIFFGVSLLIKPQALAIAPVLCLFLIKNFSIKNAFWLIIPALLTFFFFSIPFFTSIAGPYNLFSQMIADYPFNSLFAFNFWGSIGFWIEDKTTWQDLSYKDWGYLLYGIYLFIISYFYLKKKLNIYTLATLALLAFFFLPTRAHERYLYPSLIFLTLSAYFFKSKSLFILTFILSILHLGNLYFVYVYYNEIFGSRTHVLYWQPLYNLLDNGRFFSVISTTLFGILSFIKLKLNYDKNH